MLRKVRRIVTSQVCDTGILHEEIVSDPLPKERRPAEKTPDIADIGGWVWTPCFSYWHRSKRSSG